MNMTISELTSKRSEELLDLLINTDSNDRKIKDILKYRMMAVGSFVWRPNGDDVGRDEPRRYGSDYDLIRSGTPHELAKWALSSGWQGEGMTKVDEAMGYVRHAAADPGYSIDETYDPAVNFWKAARAKIARWRANQN